MLRRLSRTTLALTTAATLYLAPIAASGEVIASGAQQDHRYADALKTVNQWLADWLNRTIRIDETVYLASSRCGEVNAHYYPATSTTAPTVIMCAELVQDIVDEFRYENLTRSQLNEAAMAVVAFVMLHEIGHALIDVLDLPVLGEHENAADQFAALGLVRRPRLALWAAEYWTERDDFGDLGIFKGFARPTPFADEHDFDRQRAADVLCYVYGSDPDRYQDLAKQLGRSASRCANRFRHAEKSWGRLLEPYIRSP